jgi:hypothetical protein
MSFGQEEIAAPLGGDKQPGYGGEIGPCRIEVLLPMKSMQC